MRRAARSPLRIVASALGALARPGVPAPGVLVAALVAAALAPAAATTVWPAAAAADVFGPISLASESLAPAADRVQAEYAHDPAISADGRYVAFDGSLGGVGGVWRRDLQTGEVQAVVRDSEGECGKTAHVCYAELPSISADGRYVSFTADLRLDPKEDTNRGPDVYVRDMEKGASEPGAFTLASAVDGSAQGLAYEAPSGPGGGPPPARTSFEEESYGAVASGRSALSADGRRVAFVTTSPSNLAGPGTPALQVAVRDLDTDTTRLVSVAYDPATGRPAIDPGGADEPVSATEGAATFGAVYAPNGAAPPFGAPAAYGLTSAIGASLSADGSTVAWMGQDVGRQAPTLSEDSLPAYYAEPLWRRIADGPETATRRVTGGSDPAAPACLASGETVLLEPLTPTDPCEGPFRSEAHASGASGIWKGGIGDPVPQLSADGRTVAFLSQAPTFAEGSDFGQTVEDLPSDLFVADMAAGLTRPQALAQLTELAGANLTDLSTTAPIVDLAISSDGAQVAFTTQRTSFPLGSPAYVSARAAVPGMVELFDADLQNGTLTRVTQGFEGGPSEHPHGTATAGKDPYAATDGALSPSFSGDGDVLAFSCTASNLVYGDGNTPPGNSAKFDGSDAFVVRRVNFEGSPAQQYVSPPPPGPALEPAWLLGVTAVSRRDGSVLLEVDAPAAGRLSAGARAAVVLSLGRSAHGSRRHRARSRASGVRGRVGEAHSGAGGAGGAHSRAGGARGRAGDRAGGALTAHTVAAATAAAAAGGPLELTLTLAPRYRALAAQSGGLPGIATVTFTVPGQPVLRQSVPVTFITRGRPSGRAARHRGRQRRARGGRGR